MAERKRKMILGLMLNGVGMHQASWRKPDSRVEEAYSLSLYRDAVRLAEKAKIHLIFLADSPLHSQKLFPVRPLRFLESVTLGSALAAISENIGVVCTLSTTFTEPFNVARQLSSLDHLSKGRAGWNIVTSYDGAHHYSDKPMLDHSARHKRAAEYVEVISRLFNSVDKAALVMDRERGIFGDPSHVHIEKYEGEIFRITGPLNLPRSPQGRPVYVQAGTSESGKNLAAAYADMVYALSPTLKEAQEYYADLKARTAKAGRDPDHIKVLPGCSPVIGETEAEALSMHRQLNDLINFEVGVAQLQDLLPGVDLSAYDLDEAIPAEAFPETSSIQVMQSRYELYRYMSVERRFTIRQLVEHNCTAGGHWSPVGAAEQIAAEMEERFDLGGADGFNMSALYQPGGVARITNLLVPALQARGCFRTEYEPGTLRDNLGLPYPEEIGRG
ncbi:NtaA/DmoA family FMN-dependent monooxygenase [Chelativorans sp. J32]|uniref:NtaA/DmoA family FMN-dependent monooxygenase n=1 Tax=Chelativorans sp. J32 TaxID=935840 RepID=UPI000482578D|nr:NtaA/DmoA family FMN-dependent monooxygenase [Chelativorans sp. J32]